MCSWHTQIPASERRKAAQAAAAAAGGRAKLEEEDEWNDGDLREGIDAYWHKHTTMLIDYYAYWHTHTTIYVSSYYYICVLILLCGVLLLYGNDGEMCEGIDGAIDMSTYGLEQE